MMYTFALLYWLIGFVLGALTFRAAPKYDVTVNWFHPKSLFTLIISLPLLWPVAIIQVAYDVLPEIKNRSERSG